MVKTDQSVMLIWRKISFFKLSGMELHTRFDARKTTFEENVTNTDL